MTLDTITDITRDALYIIIRCSAPILLVSLVVGLVVSIFQTATSIQEQTLTFVPKFICVFLTIILCGNFIMTTIIDYINNLWGNFSIYIK